jgi:hypothetical protein
VGLQFLPCDLSDTRELAVTRDSTTTDSELEVHSTTDHNSESESDLWEGFDFPQLTAEEDAQLTLALQGETSRPTTSSTAMSPHEATADYSYMHSGVQGPTDQNACDWGPSSSPPPYMAGFGERDNSQSLNSFFLIDNNVVPTSSTNGQFYTVDGVYHVIRQM